ncbi:hypothetical protein CPJCM30710_25360 [Clostridium polyendosporum]|uniref:Uncharacterized protein n=1 Tax=Clostridium polyendosporum TaxID=69208 RepID=A0A919S0A8_9CLOT|nr:aspartyl-phosphate phosphatase Spo0E family protein [Clostridium polyendosporum]GIM29870.1 hypothetical protein CPJCM30710_25360 [Clostridium polyendosporum]
MEELRQELHKYIEEVGISNLTNEKTVQLSQKLDIEVVEAMKKINNKINFERVLSVEKNYKLEVEVLKGEVERLKEENVNLRMAVCDVYMKNLGLKKIVDNYQCLEKFHELGVIVVHGR